jgi:hypothetical protein
MRWQNITAKDLQEIVDKLDLKPRTTKSRGPHPVYWYCLNGRKILHTPLPNVHSGSGSLSTGFLTQIRKNLRLTNREFERLVECPLTPEDFEAIVQERVMLDRQF